MRRRYLPHAAAAASVLATAAVAAWGFWIAPDRAYRWFLLGGFLPALWASVEFAQVRGDDAEVGAAIMDCSQVYHRLRWLHALVTGRAPADRACRAGGSIVAVRGATVPRLDPGGRYGRVRKHPPDTQVTLAVSAAALRVATSSSVRWRDLCTGRAWRRDILSLVLLPTVPDWRPWRSAGVTT